MKFQVLFKVAQPKIIEADNLREAQDSAYERWPWSVIYVRQVREV